MFLVNKQGDLEFMFGKEAWDKGHEMALKCHSFIEDDEDEQVSDIDRSCYNCRFRRWTSSTFVCKRN